MTPTTETAPANPEMVMGRRWLDIVGPNGVPKWFGALLERHMAGDCGDAWVTDDDILDQLHRSLNNLPFESRWKTPLGLLVICTFCSGHYIGIETMPYS